MRNRAMCLNCKDIIESKYTHDYQVCSCWVESDEELSAWAVENGYLIPNPDKDSILKFIDNPDKPRDNRYWRTAESFHTGIMVDGGRDYQRYGGNMKNFRRLEDNEYNDD